VYLVYQPEGQDEPKRWKYDHRRINTMEREAIEKRTGSTFAEFTQQVIKGSSLCRRALLFTFQRREHPGLRWEDCVFDNWDELRLEFSRQEYEQRREEVMEKLQGDDLAAALQAIDAELETAFDDPDDAGKARQPFAV
jgi:hypothetical protein